MGLKLENFLYSPVLRFYWQNKELKEEIYYAGLIRHIKRKNISFLLTNILKSIYRLKFFVTFKKYNNSIYSVKYGLKSLTQKKIIHGQQNDIEYFKKLPVGTLAHKSLINESKALKEFNAIGIKTMEKLDLIGDFCYSAVKGENKYLPDLIFINCVSKYPIKNKTTISDYFLDNKYFDRKIIDIENEIELAISHGDLTVWNTFYDNGNFIMIDIECFKKSKIRYFDILYYILSYEFYVNKNGHKIIFKKLTQFMKNHKIESYYLILFFYDLLEIKKTDLKDGFFIDIKSRLINEIDQLIRDYETY